LARVGESTTEISFDIEINGPNPLRGWSKISKLNEFDNVKGIPLIIDGAFQSSTKVVGTKHSSKEIIDRRWK
jgi:hypothetical protein